MAVVLAKALHYLCSEVYGAGLDCDDLKELTDDQAGLIYKSQYWNPCNGDKIKSQRIANLLVDWAVNSGVRTACKGLQRILGVTVDGIIGPQTLNAINCFEDDGFIYDALMDERKNSTTGLLHVTNHRNVSLKDG